MSNTMMDFMSISSGGGFPAAMYSGPGGPMERLSSVGGGGNGGGQKVVCTPEVSLYTYNGNGPNAVPSPASPISVDDKGGGGSGLVVDLDVATDPLAIHTPNGFQCGVCGKIFQQKNTFQNHLRSHREGEDPYRCDICGKTFAVPARLTRHYRTHTGEKPYECEYCNKSFSVKENLSVHRRIHTKERPYKCEVCERAFEHSGKLHRHMRIHTGERPHRCQICQKTFIQSGQLVIHMRTHTGEKPYVCKVCSKGFTCSKQLKVHSRTHTGEKPYSCDICGKSFGYNHVLKLHQVAHYGEKVYKCTICNSTFNSKKALESHIKTHSSSSSSSSEPMSPSMTPPPLSSSSAENPRNLSPPSSSLGAPTHSDKENRESSDSEVSSQNSPTASDSPRSPPSPKIYTSPSSGRSTNQGKSGLYGGPVLTGSSSSLLSSLPYPMLPPGVQIHQPPQSRTTFLYVTSKLPTQIGGGGGSTGNNNSNSFNSGGGVEVNLRNSCQVKPPPPPRQTDVAREKFLRQSASIRDKVLASIEMFGYGLSGDSSSSSSSSSSSNGSTDLSIRPKGVQITPVTPGSGGGSPGFGRGSKYVVDSPIINNRNTMSGGALVREGNNNNVSITPIPENLTNYAQLSNRGGGYGRGEKSSRDECPPCSYPTKPPYYPSSYHHPSHYAPLSKVRERSRSPESSPAAPRAGYNFGSGGVLALALTRGSKAVVNQLPFGLTTPLSRSRPLVLPPTPPTTHQTPPHSNPDSPDLCIDFSRRSGSISPILRNNGFHSPTPSTTPRSTPGLSESAEDLSEVDYTGQHVSLSPIGREGLEMGGLGKRTGSNGSNYGPRKRSSLILEKYAQENTPTTVTTTTESILSQRLRQSTVIQFAERCT